MRNNILLSYMWLHWWLPVTISHHTVKFDGQRPCRTGDIMFSIWHLTSHDHMIRESCKLHRQYPTTFGGQTSSGERYISFLVFHVTTRPRSLSNIWLLGCLYLTISHQLAMFCGHRSCQRVCITPLICHMNTLVQWPHRWVSLTISHQPVMIGGHKPCGREDL